MSMSNHVSKLSNIIVILVLKIEAHGPFLNICLFYHNDDMTCAHKIYIFLFFGLHPSSIRFNTLIGNLVHVFNFILTFVDGTTPSF